MGKVKKNRRSYSTAADLHVSVFTGNIEEMEWCVKDSELINSYWRGVTPVSSAINLNRPQILKILVNSGANCNLRTRNNRMEPPLFSACRQKDRLCIDLLMHSSTIDIEQEDFFGRSALWSAARYCSADIVEYLLSKGAKLNKVKEKRFRRHPIVGALEQTGKHAYKVVNLLVRQGSLLDSVCEESPLKWAVKQGDRDIFCLLIEAGCIVRDESWLAPENLPMEWRTNSSFCDWIDSLKHSPKSLKLLTTCKIRSILIEKFDTLRHVPIDHLGLPESLNSTILFADFDISTKIFNFGTLLRLNLPDDFSDYKV